MTHLSSQVDQNSRISAIYPAGTLETIKETKQVTPTPAPTATVVQERRGAVANFIKNIQTSCNEIVDKGKKALKNSSLLVACRISKGQKSAVTETHTEPLNQLNTNVMNIDVIKESIGNYGVEDNNKNDAIREILTQKPKLKKILYHNVPPVESKDCRNKFVDYLGKLVADKKFSNPGGTIKLEDFLDKEGLKLYKAAVAEEKNSKAFRDAVLAQATEKRPGTAWPEQTIIWIGGPSASGKSFSRDAVLETVDQNKQTIYKNSQETHSAEKTSNVESHNLIVSVDGGIERELGQMRQLVLQAAFNKGFTGIQDLHKHTNLSVKGTIKKVALASKTMHLVIPATFANPKGMKDLITFSLRPKTKQIFAEVVGQDPKTFQDSTYHQGNSRAWKPQNKKWDSITINNKIKYESKEYQKKFFSTGLKGSRLARNLFLKTAKNPNYIKITNDLVFLKALEEVDQNSPGAIKLTRGQLEEYKGLEKRPSLEEWLETDEAKILGQSSDFVFIKNDSLDRADTTYNGATTRVTQRQLEAYKNLDKATRPAIETWLTKEGKKLGEPKVDLKQNVSFQQRITGLIPPV